MRQQTMNSSKSTSSVSLDLGEGDNICEEFLNEFRSGVGVKDRKYHMKLYPQCFVGEDAVKWLVWSGRADGVDEAIILGDYLMKKGVFRHVTNDHSFKNKKLFYRFSVDAFAAMQRKQRSHPRTSPRSLASPAENESKQVACPTTTSVKSTASGVGSRPASRKEKPTSLIRSSQHRVISSEIKLDPVIKQDTFAVGFEQITFKKKIGGGAFATVYEAEWLHTPVAVKLFREEMLVETNPLLSQREPDPDETDSGARQEFIQECRLLSSLRHPNIVLYLAASADPGKPLCMIQQLYRGGNLAQFISAREGNPVIVQEAAKIGLGIARGLHYLHSLTPRILHRDLKCENVLLMDRTSLDPVIADLGLSCIRKPEDLSRVGGGYMVGTVTTMAPEVMKGRPYTTAADVYSLCIVLWELFTNKRAFSSYQSTVELIYRVTKGKRPSISKEHHIPAAVLDVLVRGWETEASLRPSLEVIVDVLEGLLR
eukprot:Plantae.Rhodophyta-Rhodochaete_pulchella.ctg599.p1 GENE.Plantae.Rhodophyta-Rhodochaete_pulchella.ctg599~~Plantae.Rhodophyta-Rhodochaete_pulchella.ctg599.p1  ORF type:complete len:483 (-),score=57.86 Plantae.Rhodophyta-Rhodochaete_pulchella.ctg599:301-1749(-)